LAKTLRPQSAGGLAQSSTTAKLAAYHRPPFEGAGTMRTTGTVKWFNESKGYGFITPEGTAQDCFVHHSRIQGRGYRTLSEGEKVEFDLIETDKGQAAENVVRIGA
jgi:CspA family cold shock protein